MSYLITANNLCMFRLEEGKRYSRHGQLSMTRLSCDLTPLGDSTQCSEAQAFRADLRAYDRLRGECGGKVRSCKTLLGKSPVDLVFYPTEISSYKTFFLTAGAI